VLLQVFEIPGRLPGYNELNSGHWATRYAIKQRAVSDVYYCIKDARIQPVGRAVVYIRCYEGTRRRDVDNVQSGASKVVLDALVTARVLKNDSRRYVKDVIAMVEIAKEPRVEVVIEEVEIA